MLCPHIAAESQAPTIKHAWLCSTRRGHATSGRHNRGSTARRYQKRRGARPPRPPRAPRIRSSAPSGSARASTPRSSPPLPTVPPAVITCRQPPAHRQRCRPPAAFECTPPPRSLVQRVVSVVEAAPSAGGGLGAGRARAADRAPARRHPDARHLGGGGGGAASDTLLTPNPYPRCVSL